MKYLARTIALGSLVSIAAIAFAAAVLTAVARIVAGA